ncbi:MAG TPA: helix-turn-helix transcriptional regulator [Terriglobales bacterium]|jgi:transcriptional regulator with XRE-family HTH domain|nr:helix-turn-helix transcriptional regulator [Terriglobales bacterium]
MPKRPTITKPLDFHGETIGQRLTQLRKQRGYTQVELAEKIGIRQVLVSAYEKDRRGLSAEMAIHFALALDVSLDELLRPKGKKVSGKKPSRKVLRRLEEIEKLPPHQQNYLLKTIDGFLRGAVVAV